MGSSDQEAHVAMCVGAPPKGEACKKGAPPVYENFAVGNRRGSKKRWRNNALLRFVGRRKAVDKFRQRAKEERVRGVW
jgi:hypothetical protein